MAVRTDDLALLDLSEDALPTPVHEPLADVEYLVAKVVELEDDGIGLAAIRAGVEREVLEAIARALA
jgi:hypothetical protein